MNEDFKLDFVGIAAPRSGTTWISRCLGEHPDICVPFNKEPHFFLYDSRYNQGVPYLTRLFRHYNGEKLKGEWSNMYLYSPEAARRLHAHNPDMKILMCLRNPVERAYSQYLNRKYNASIMPLYSFKYVVDHEAKYQYLAWGKYAPYIRYYQSLFPKENIHIMLYEEVIRDPEGEFKKLLSFLGVESNFAPPSLHRTINDRGKNKYYSLYGQSVLNKLTGWYKASRLRPVLDSWGVRNLLRSLEKANKRKTLVPFAKPPMDPKVKKRLTEYFAKEIVEVESILGCNLDIWKEV